MVEQADLVIEVRHYNLTAGCLDSSEDQPGRAALAILRNRRGPTYTVGVDFQPHYARFVDTSRN